MLNVYNKFGSKISLFHNPIFTAPQYDMFFLPDEYNETSRLFYLCKVWGFVKYYHESLPLSPCKMENALMEAIPKVVHASSKEEYTAILDSLLFFCDSLFTDENPYPDIHDYYLISNDWMNDTICLVPNITEKLETIFRTHSGKGNHFVENRPSGNIRLKNEPVYTLSDYPDQTLSLLILFRYWNLINYFYVYKNEAENWDRVLYESIPRFLDIASKKQYHTEIYRLTNQLRDTHTSYPPTVDNLVFGPFRPNFRMKCINDTFVISNIRVPHLPKEHFQVGDIVLQVDHKDVRLEYDSLLHYVCGGNYWSNQHFGCNAVLSKYDSNTVFTLLRGNDTLMVISNNNLAYDLFQKEQKILKQREKDKSYQWVNDSIAYLDLHSITPKNFNKNYKPIKSASVIILDLRCYPNGLLISNLTDAFVPPNSFFAYCTYPDVRFPGLVKYAFSSNKIGKKSYFKGRVVVLINEYTTSYAEYTAMALQANPKTITVGNYSSGADGNVSFYGFPGGVKTSFSGIGIYYPDLTPTQRVGVRLDYIAEPTIESITNQMDVAYEKAVEIAKQGVRK